MRGMSPVGAPATRGLPGMPFDDAPARGGCRSRHHPLVHNRQPRVHTWPEAALRLAVLVELNEQPGLRVLSNVVGCRIADVDVGRRVEAVFVPYEEHTMLYFTPIGDAP